MQTETHTVKSTCEIGRAVHRTKALGYARFGLLYTQPYTEHICDLQTVMAEPGLNMCAFKVVDSGFFLGGCVQGTCRVPHPKGVLSQTQGGTVTDPLRVG